MNHEKLSRRAFLRGAALAAAGAGIVACQPQTVVVKETVEVEKVVKETVEVEKVVKETVQVEKEKVVEKQVTTVVEKEVTPTPLPSEFREASELADMVAAGTLPGVDERLPETPMVVEPWEGTGEYGGTWHMVVKTDPNSHVSELLKYNPLLRYAPGGIEILPNLAASWEMTENGTAYVVTLRKGVSWSDGAPLTADDIVFWGEDVMSNTDLYGRYPSWLRAGGEGPQIAKLDDYSVRFKYSTPSPFFARQIGYPNRHPFDPKHYLTQFHAKYVDQAELDAKVKEHGVDNWVQLFLDRASHDTNPERPVHFGWKLETLEEDGAVWLANPYFWAIDPEGNQLPYIGRVESQVAANVEVAQMMAFSGEAELQTFSVGQFPADTMILKKNAEMGNYHVIDAPISEPNVLVLAVNMTVNDEVLREIFRDKRFRIALSHGVNREDIRQLVYLGQPKETRQVAALRESPYYHEGAAQSHVEYDPDKANALLDEMGLTDRDGDGVRLRSDGEPISIVIEVPSKRTDYIDAMEMVAQWWSDLGLKVTMKAPETSLYFERLRANELQAGVDYAGPGLFPMSNPQRMIAINNRYLAGPLWGIWYNSEGEQGEEPPPEIQTQEQLYEEVMITPDEEKQVALWAEAMDITAEHRWNMGICDRASVPIVVSNTFRNVPETGWNIGWEGGNIGTTFPEQYWKEE